MSGRHAFPFESPTAQDRNEERPEFVDSSGPLYAMYREMTEDEDTKMAERWQADAKAMFLFAGLFSAAVAPLVSLTIPDLKPKSQDTSAFYLENIYQLLARSNASPASIPSSLAQPPSFSPPNYAIWVNSLWLLTLVINLSCALLAILLHQCTHRYLEITQRRRSSPQEQARIREFFAHGIREWYLPLAIEVLPQFLYFSIFLFFSGLLIYLFNVDLSVYIAVGSWIAISALGYLLITVMPIFRLNSPYYSPLSPLAWSLYAGMLYYSFLLFSCISCFWCWAGNLNPLRLNHLLKYYHDRFSQGMEKEIKTTVRRLSTEIDGRIVKSMVRSTLQGSELDQFVQCIFSFCRSKMVNEPQGILRNLVGPRLSSVLVAFSDRTWSSSSEWGHLHPFVICVKLADVAHLSDVVLRILHDIFDSDNHMVLRSVEIGHSLRSRGDRSFQKIGLCAQLVVAGIIADGDQSDKSWIALATDQLGERLTCYHEHGRDSVLLANLIHVTRLISASSSDGLDIGDRISYIVLPRLSNLDIRNTLPELQHEFAALWNEIVEVSRGADARLNHHILNCVAPIYSALNRSNDAALAITQGDVVTEPAVAAHIHSIDLPTFTSPSVPIVSARSRSSPVPQVPSSSRSFAGGEDTLFTTTLHPPLPHAGFSVTVAPPSPRSLSSDGASREQTADPS